MRRSNQPIDDRLVGLIRLVGQKGVDFLERRRQPGQIERQTANQRLATRLGRGLETLSFQTREDESVDGTARPMRVFHRRLRRPHRPNERPMFLPLRPFSDPAAQQLDFIFRQRLARFLGRHPLAGVLGRDPVNQFARLRLARHDWMLPRVGQSQSALLLIQPKSPFSVFGIGTMTAKTPIAEKRPNLSVEVNLRAGWWSCDARRASTAIVMPPTPARNISAATCGTERKSGEENFSIATTSIYPKRRGTPGGRQMHPRIIVASASRLENSLICRRVA